MKMAGQNGKRTVRQLEHKLVKVHRKVIILGLLIQVLY